MFEFYASIRQPIFTSNLKSVPSYHFSLVAFFFLLFLSRIDPRARLLRKKKKNNNNKNINKRLRKEEKEEDKGNEATIGREGIRRIRNARKYGEGLIVAGWDLLQLIEGGARRILRTPPGA